MYIFVDLNNLLVLFVLYFFLRCDIVLFGIFCFRAPFCNSQKFQNIVGRKRSLDSFYDSILMICTEKRQRNFMSQNV